MLVTRDTADEAATSIVDGERDPRARTAGRVVATALTGRSGDTPTPAEFEPLLDALPYNACLVESDGTIVATNTRWRTFSSDNAGCPAATGRGANYFAVCDAAQADSDATRMSDMLRAVLERREASCVHEYPCDSPSTRSWIRTRVLSVDLGARARALVLHEDITTDHAEVRSRQFADAILANGHGAILRVTESGRLDWLNATGEAMLGGLASELIGQPIGHFDVALRGARWSRKWRDLLESGVERTRSVLRRADRSTIPVTALRYIVEVERQRFAVVCLTDITAQRGTEKRARYLATHDTLTGLPQRQVLVDRVADLIAASGPGRPVRTVFKLGIDRLRQINDAFGRAGGDTLLRTVAGRLIRRIGGSDIVARIDGDCFALVVTLPTEEDRHRLVHDLAGCVTEPVVVSNGQILATACIGVCSIESNGQDAEAVLRDVDLALSTAKREGPGTVLQYRAELRSRGSRDAAIESALRGAPGRGELRLVYQPQVNLLTGRVIGFEALLRWRSTDLGDVSPGEFIPIAERTGLIHPIGLWTLRTACRQAAIWQRRLVRPVRVWVNLSPEQFRSGDLLATVSGLLGEFELQPSLLGLELTESALMRDLDGAIRTLETLRSLGVDVALDDFGTGYSSLAYLKRLPLGALKIDRAFIDDVGTAPEAASITRTIIAMAHALQLRAVAEGVESESQLAALTAHGCDEIQGNFFSEPLSPDAADDLLAADRGLPARVSAHGARRLLLVDDEVNILSALRRLLRRTGCDVRTAASGEEALAVLAQHPVDVIVSDQRMPGMTGVELLRRAKELYPDTVRIVLSGYTELQSVTSAINEGAIYKFLAKPWNDAQLLEQIEDAFRRKELIDDNHRLDARVRAANSELARLNSQLKYLLAAQREQFECEAISLDIAREVIEQIPLPIIGLDEDGCVSLLNRSAQEVLPGGPALLGRSCAEALSIGTCGAPGMQAEPAIRLAGRSYEVTRTALGKTSSSRGTLIMLKQAATGDD